MKDSHWHTCESCRRSYSCCCDEPQPNSFETGVGAPGDPPQGLCEGCSQIQAGDDEKYYSALDGYVAEGHDRKMAQELASREIGE